MPVIDDILKTAREAGASDVHITVGVSPKMCVNGSLLSMDYYPKMLPADTLEALLSIMSEAQRERFEETGEFTMSYSEETGRYRVSVYKQRGLVALAIRLVNGTIPSMEELGIPDSVAALYQKKKGLIVVTGQSGSGTTTTLAALIDSINRNREVHILTIENPIEYVHLHQNAVVDQREIGTDTESTALALHAAMRENADVIMLGELQDVETIEAAITAAETGHLVLAEFHINGAANTIERLVEAFPIERQEQIRRRLSSTLEAVVSQRLLETEEQSRIAAFEVLLMNQTVRKIIREGKFTALVPAMQANKKSGMMSMEDAVKLLFAEGKISKQTAVEVLQDVIEGK